MKVLRWKTRKCGGRVIREPIRWANREIGSPSSSFSYETSIFFYHYIFTFYIFHCMIYYERDTYEIELKVWVPFSLQEFLFTSISAFLFECLFLYIRKFIFKVWFTFIYQTVLLYCSLFVCISYLSALLVSILYWNKFYALTLWIRFFISGRSSCLIRKTVVDVVEIPNKSND